jgi:hypothetical protein
MAKVGQLLWDEAGTSFGRNLPFTFIQVL